MLYLCSSGFPLQPHASIWLVCTVCCSKAFTLVARKYMSLPGVPDGFLLPAEILGRLSLHMGFLGLCLDGCMSLACSRQHSCLLFLWAELLLSFGLFHLPPLCSSDKGFPSPVYSCSCRFQRGHLPRVLLGTSASQKGKLPPFLSSGQEISCYLELFRHVIIHTAYYLRMSLAASVSRSFASSLEY